MEYASREALEFAEPSASLASSREYLNPLRKHMKPILLEYLLPIWLENMI